jgi:hypothetical protein
MLAAVKREEYEDRLDAQQRQIDDIQRRQTDEDREDRNRRRENTARRQEATERGTEEERVRLRIDSMRLNRAIATFVNVLLFGRNIPLHKLKLQAFSGDPAQVYGQITSSMESQFLGSFSGNPAAAYAKVCAIIAESAEMRSDLSPNDLISASRATRSMVAET